MGFWVAATAQPSIRKRSPISRCEPKNRRCCRLFKNRTAAVMGVSTVSRSHQPCCNRVFSLLHVLRGGQLPHAFGEGIRLSSVQASCLIDAGPRGQIRHTHRPTLTRRSRDPTVPTSLTLQRSSVENEGHPVPPYRSICPTGTQSSQRYRQCWLSQPRTYVCSKPKACAPAGPHDRCRCGSRLRVT